MTNYILKPHKDYYFVDHDKVFVGNLDGTADYFELYYEECVSEWLLFPFTDKHFTTPKVNKEGKTIAEPLSAYGYDLLNRIVNFKFGELPTNTFSVERISFDKEGDTQSEVCDDRVPAIKPPLGLSPKRFHDESTRVKRFNEILSAIARYLEAGLKINIEWIDEYNELCDSVRDNNLKQIQEPDNSSSLSLESLERRLDEQLGKETRETLSDWLNAKRQLL